ncbi:unnamed protein product [Rhizoctonia solani]|uniref:G2/mitotic-specific cyclin cdc13 n=1 Tax=Rhizoctonia solani TaxID=456999 RepID=A0A8H3H6J0_9AGAM|nr:unnamed protein product [Rhizoctonia solani]
MISQRIMKYKGADALLATTITTGTLITMDSMEIDRKDREYKPNMRYTDEDIRFDQSVFNEDVRGAIKQYKINNPPSFQSHWPSIDDLALLLHILFKRRLKICRMDYRVCKEYLTRNQPFALKLYAAYASRKFAEIMKDPDMPLKQAQEPVSGISPSSSTHSLQEAFKQPYMGDTAKLFIKALDNERRKMIEEVSKTIFTIPINIREKLLGGKIAGEELANAWADYLKIGQTEEEVGPNRREFYERVVQTATRIARETGQNRGKLGHFLRKSWTELAELIRPANQSTHANECFVYFDEAHSLAEGVEEPRESHQRSPYHNLGTVLSKLAEGRVFFIFLSANSSLKGFAPPPSHHPSEMVTHGARLIPPFTELLYDVYEHEVLEGFGSLTLRNVCKTTVLVGFGRIMWYAGYKSKPNKNPFIFALDKLSPGSTTSRQDNAILAVPNSSSRTSAWFIPSLNNYMHTGSPSEPILAEAASRYLNGPGFDGVAVEGAKMLSTVLEKVLIARGERGEIVGRLLITSAHDVALGPLDNLDLESPDPHYHCPIPNLRSAFSESFVFFSHFALAEDSEMLSTSSLATTLVQGMAIQAMDGQASIDAVIPIHMGSLTTPISSKTTSAINLQFRNRRKALDRHVNRLITVPNVEMPVISILFEFGVTENVSVPVTISREPEDGLHGDDRHYQIVAYGCNHTVFRAIPVAMDSKYESILRGNSILEDFPRYQDQDNKEAILALRPANCGKRQYERYSKLMELETGKDPIGC